MIMAENLAELWSKLSLSEKESINVKAIDNEVKEIVGKG